MTTVGDQDDLSLLWSYPWAGLSTEQALTSYVVLPLKVGPHPPPPALQWS